MFKYTPFIKLNFGFVCVRVGVQKVSIYSLTVSDLQPLFTSISTQFQPLLLVLLLKTELLNWFLCLFLGWECMNKEKKSAIPKLFKLN